MIINMTECMMHVHLFHCVLLLSFQLHVFLCTLALRALLIPSYGEIPFRGVKLQVSFFVCCPPGAKVIWSISYGGLFRLSAQLWLVHCKRLL